MWRRGRKCERRRGRPGMKIPKDEASNWTEIGRDRQRNHKSHICVTGGLGAFIPFPHRPCKCYILLCSVYVPGACWNVDCERRDSFPIYQLIRQPLNILHRALREQYWIRVFKRRCSRRVLRKYEIKKIADLWDTRPFSEPSDTSVILIRTLTKWMNKRI